jgi:hypothetical protein
VLVFANTSTAARSRSKASRHTAYLSSSHYINCPHSQSYHRLSPLSLVCVLAHLTRSPPRAPHTPRRPAGHTTLPNRPTHTRRAAPHHPQSRSPPLHLDLTTARKVFDASLRPRAATAMASAVSAAAKASAAFAHKVRALLLLLLLPPSPPEFASPLLTPLPRSPPPSPAAEGARRGGAGADAAPRGLGPPYQAVPRARRRLARARAPRPGVHRLGTPS